MSLYLKQIEQLISLQKVDDEIHSVKNELESAPKELENLRVKFAEIKEQRERQTDKMAHLSEQVKRLGIEIDDESARIKKSRNKLMQATTSKEYHAMVREMDNLERTNKDREEEKTALVEEVTRQTAIQEEVEGEYTRVKEELEALEKTIDERTGKARASLEQLLLKRKETAKEVPSPVFVRYEFIRERLSHPIIVPVSGGICTGCFIAIPPQNFIELQKGTQILSCPNCQRLMFWSEHFNPGENAPKE